MTVAARDLARRLDRLALKARPVFIWISAEDTQEEIAARAAQLGPAERRNVQFIGWQDAADVMQEAVAFITNLHV